MLQHLQRNLLLIMGIAFMAVSVAIWGVSYRCLVTMYAAGAERSGSVVIVRGKILFESNNLDFLPGSKPVRPQLEVKKLPPEELTARWFQALPIPGGVKFYISLPWIAVFGLAMTLGARWLRRVKHAELPN